MTTTPNPSARAAKDYAARLPPYFGPPIPKVLSDDFFRRGGVYFDGVWRQTHDQPEVQPLLRALAQREAPWAEVDLQAANLYDLEALTWAERHDVLRRVDGRWAFCVPLMQRFVRERRAS